MAISYTTKDWLEVFYAFLAVAVAVLIILFTYCSLYPSQAPDWFRAVFGYQVKDKRKSKVGFKVVKESNPFALHE
jgi:hypothetical protein